MNAIDSCPLEMLGMNFEWIGMGISTINNLDIKAIAGRTYLHDGKRKNRKTGIGALHGLAIAISCNILRLAGTKQVRGLHAEK